jgi:putative transposase
MITRKNRRLVDLDYAYQEYYFVTVCVHNADTLFGTIQSGNILLNPVGEMIDKWWHEIFNKFDTALLDTYIVMPDHVHGIIHLSDDGDSEHGRTHTPDDGRPHTLEHGRPHTPADGRPHTLEHGRPHRAAPTNAVPTIVDIVGWFKTMSTNEYIRRVKNDNWKPFREHFWQRSFHDRVIRSKDELNDIRAYIKNNPCTDEKLVGAGLCARP